MNKIISTVPHNPFPPVQVMREVNDVLIIEGVRFSGEFFRSLAEVQQKCQLNLPLVETMNDLEVFFLEHTELTSV